MRKISHRHSTLPLICVKFLKGIIDSLNAWKWSYSLTLRYNTSHRHWLSILRSALRYTTTPLDKRKFSIFFIITEELLPAITGWRHLLKCAFWEIYEWRSTKDVRVYSSWIFQYTSREVCALNTSGFYGVMITYSRLGYFRIFSFSRSARCGLRSVTMVNSDPYR